jgi:DNA-3-methyladenine glycosylase II
LRRRPDNAIDGWDGQTYRRVYVLADEPVAIAVQQEGPAATPVLRVDVRARRLPPDAAAAICRVLERMFGLRTDLSDFYRMADSDPRLGPLARRLHGLKPPRFPSVFEALVNAIACQQLTLTVGILLLGRLAGACGVAAPEGTDNQHAFPRPEDLARLDPQVMRTLGFSGQKSRALSELGQAIAGQRLDLEALACLDNTSAVAQLMKLRGVGRWSAEYVLLRGLGRLDTFPGDDVGARNNLARWLGRPEPLDYARVQAAVAPWQPYAGLVYFHLLLERLTAAGAIAV